jgi:hypothetical protein
MTVATLRGEAAPLREAGSFAAARLSGTDMPDDLHPLPPKRRPEDINLVVIYIGC